MLTLKQIINVLKFLRDCEDSIMSTEYKYDSKVMAIHRLRVNIKSLAAEARIIRQEEERAGIAYKFNLHLHRVTRLRTEARVAHLALAYLRGRAYHSVEQKAHTLPNHAEIRNKLSRMGWGVDGDTIPRWLKG